MGDHKTYLGDGVYVALERGMAKLTTEDGYRVTNTIYLEPEVIGAFMSWLAALDRQEDVPEDDD